jgi:transposase
MFNKQAEYQNIYPALDCLVSISEQKQREFKDSNMSLGEFSDTICTIKCQTARRGGHDYGISELILKKGWNALIVVINMEQKKSFLDNFNNYKKITRIDKGTIDVITCSSDNKPVLQGKDLSNIDAIIFNCASFIGNEQKERIKNEIISSPKKEPFFYIFVQ